MRIRVAAEKDAPALIGLCSQLGYEYPLDNLIEHLLAVLHNPEHIVLVAEDDEGKVCGYTHASEYLQLYFDRMLNVLAMVVDEQQRSRGVGAQLLEELEKWANERNIRWIRAASASKRTDAHRFYKNNGFLSRKDQVRLLKELK